MRFDCAQMENEFLRKRLQQFEERLDSELTSRKELEQQVRGRRSSASLKGRLSPPLFEVGEKEGGPTHAIFPPPLSLQMLVPVGHGTYFFYLWVFYSGKDYSVI